MRISGLGFPEGCRPLPENVNVNVNVKMWSSVTLLAVGLCCLSRFDDASALSEYTRNAKQNSTQTNNLFLIATRLLTIS